MSNAKGKLLACVKAIRGNNESMPYCTFAAANKAVPEWQYSPCLHWMPHTVHQSCIEGKMEWDGTIKIRVSTKIKRRNKGIICMVYTCSLPKLFPYRSMFVQASGKACEEWCFAFYPAFVSVATLSPPWIGLDTQVQCEWYDIHVRRYNTIADWPWFAVHWITVLNLNNGC